MCQDEVESLGESIVDSGAKISPILEHMIREKQKKHALVMQFLFLIHFVNPG